MYQGFCLKPLIPSSLAVAASGFWALFRVFLTELPFPEPRLLSVNRMLFLITGRSRFRNFGNLLSNPSLFRTRLPGFIITLAVYKVNILPGCKLSFRAIYLPGRERDLFPWIVDVTVVTLAFGGLHLHN